MLWTNEENGGRGGQAYRDKHLGELANHVMMLESDSGVFSPTGFGFTGTESGRAKVREIATLLAGINAGLFHLGPWRRRESWLTGVPPMAARICGAVSIVLWVGVIASGRLIAYV